MKIFLNSIVILIFVCCFADAAERNREWSNVKKLKRETWIQVKTTDGRQIEGQFGDLVGERISIITGSTVQRISREEIREISKSKGGLVKSILIGAGIGFSAGLVTGMIVESGDGEDKGLFTALLASTGCIVGGAGSAIDGIDRWRLIYKRREK